MSNKDGKLIIDQLLVRFGKALKIFLFNVEQNRWTKFANAFFIFAAIIYLIFQAYVTMVNIGHQMPIGGDDGYSYLQQPAQVTDGCFFQDCPALQDLREQFLTPTDNNESAYMRNREYTRIFVLYHPLHSFILAGLHGIGLSFETAFDIVYSVGKILIPLAVIYWLLAIWGKPVATTALLLMAALVFPGQGLYVAVPTTIAAALAMVLWAMIQNKSRRTDNFFIPMVLVLLLMHTIGIFYSAIAVIIYLLFSTKPIASRKIAIASISVLLIILDVSLIFTVPQPALRFDPASFYPNWSYIGALKSSLPESLGTLINFMRSFGYWFLFVILVTLGFLLTPVTQKMKVFITGVLLAALLMLGILYVVPWYGAFTLQRVMPFAGIFLIGAVASALNGILGSIWAGAKKFVGHPPGNLSNRSTLLTGTGWRIAISALALVITAYSISNYLSVSARNYVLTAQKTEDAYFNQQQSTTINADEDAHAKILYMDELAMYYFMSHGGLDHGAVFQPALRGTSDLETWVPTSGNEIAYVVQRNPIFYLPHTPEGGIRLTEGNTILLRSAEMLDPKVLQLFVGERNNELILLISTGKNDISLKIPAGSSGWVNLPSELSPAEILRIRLGKKSTQATILGIRFSTDSVTSWPWDSGIMLDYKTSEDKLTTIEFSSTALTDGLISQLIILDDYGYSVLAKTSH